MWEDPIVEEIRKYSDEYAKKFNYDIKAILEDIRQRHKESCRPVVTLEERLKALAEKKSKLSE